MKSNIELHREALDQALRIALGTSQPALRRQALSRAASHLIHPRLVLESPLLTDSHAWRKEALLVSDAFEAVTNGMEQPGLLEALEELEADSPFQAWRHLVLAVHFYYEELDEAVRAHLARIPTESPVRALAQAIEQALGDAARVPPAPRRLAELLAQPDRLVQLWVQDVAEGLETGHEALFWGALTDWLEHLNPVSPERARSAVLWAWNQLAWREFDEAVLLDIGASLWGRGESYRLAALGSLAWDAEGAALLWARFSLSAAREAWDEGTIRQARSLLDDFRSAAEASGELSPEGQETWTLLSQAWNAEMRTRNWQDLLLETTDTAVIPPRTGQLDLFA